MQEIKKRIGNDYNFSWPIKYKDTKEPYDLTGKDLELRMYDQHRKMTVFPYTTEGNMIYWTFFGKDQRYTGKYTAELCENGGKEGMITLDTRYAITLVPHTDMEDDGEEGVISVSSVELEAAEVMLRGPRGYSAYELAVQDGYEGTEQEWLESLRPDITADEDGVLYADGELLTDAVARAASRANSAAESAEAGEAARVIAENARVNAESERVSSEEERNSAESGRQAAESARAAAESARATAESDRATAEYVRESAESSRVSEEQSRVSAETDRVEAESGRAIAEAGRQSAETARSTAESSRVSAEQSRADAESARSIAESSRVAAESAREGAEAGRVSAETAREEQAALDHERAESDHESIAEMQDDVDSLNARVAEMQPSFPWSDDFIWTDGQVWPKKKGGGGGETVTALRTMPTFRKVGRPRFGNVVYYVSHPMMDNDGAEIVLMHYAKRNGKKFMEEEEHSEFPKKGYCLACGGHASNPYFVFSAETSYDDLYDFCDSYLSPGHYGIALRIPNPDYDGHVTERKTAIYKGVPESLYSDVLPIQLSYDGEHDNWGIGMI